MAIVRKTLAVEGHNGMEFILSDATPDRYGDVIDPKGWDLVNFKKNPIALFNHNNDFPIGKWENLSVKDGGLRGNLRLAPEGTSPRIDEVRKLIEAGILKAVSVGFRPIESKPLSKSAPGELYLKSELVETSLVSVPANPNALAVAKSLGISDEVRKMVFGEYADKETITRDVGNGKHAKTSQFGKTPNMTPISKRIEDAQTRIASMREQLNIHLEGLNDETPDDGSTKISDELLNRIAIQEKSLDVLKRSEAVLAQSSTQIGGGNLPVVERSASDQAVAVVSGSRPFATPKKKIDQPSNLIFKAIAVDIKHFGEGRKRPMADVLKECYGDGEQGQMVRTIMNQMILKSAAIPADTTTSHWASDLMQTVIGDFIQSLLPHSVYPAIAARGSTFTFGRNGTISLPSRTTSTAVGGAFIAQGAAIPVKQGAFASITLTPKKMGVITTMTREITEHSLPAIEQIIRQAMLEDTGVAIDTILLDATAADTTRPAGLKNGISKVSASATASIVGFVADIKGLVAALITATAGNIRSPAWIMNPGDVLAGQLLQTTVGETPFREEMANGTLLGIPIIQTTTGLSDMMCLIDCADFISASGDTPNFSVSDQAVLHMEDTTPLALTTGGGTPSYASPVRSLWQTDTMAIRMIMDLNWAKRRTGIFQWTDTMAWN